MFSTFYGKDIIEKLGIQYIEPNHINLSKSLLGKCNFERLNAILEYFIDNKQRNTLFVRIFYGITVNITFLFLSRKPPFTSKIVILCFKFLII